MSLYEKAEQQEMVLKIKAVVDQLNGLIVKAAEKKMVIDLSIVNEIAIDPYRLRLLKPDFMVMSNERLTAING
jgi:hypothetical protein